MINPRRWLFAVFTAGALLLGLMLLAGALPVAAQGPVATPLPLFALPNPNTERVYRSGIIALAANQRYLVTANTFSGTASVVDIAGKQILAEVPVGGEPRALAVAPDQTWMAVTARAAGTLSIIDLATYEVRDTITVGLWPWGVVTDGNLLYVALQGADAIAEVSAASGRVLRTIAVPDAPTGLALYGDFLYVTHFESGALSMVYLADGSVARSTPGTPDSRLAQAVWIDPYDARAYVPATRANAASPVLVFDNTVFPVVNVYELSALGSLRRSRVVVDVADRPVNMPFDVHLDRARRWLWVANAGSNDVSVINLATGYAIANIAVGANPRGIAAYADNRFVFVYNALDGTISVIETAYMEEVDRLPATRLEVPIDWLIGAQLFHGSADARLSQDHRLSCATCHFDGGDDGQTWLGFPGGPRNTAALYGVWATPPWGWHAEFDELADLDVLFRELQHGAGLIDGLPYPALGQPNSGRSPDMDALVVYLNSLAGPGLNAQRIPPDEVLAGEAVWLTRGCAECHTPPLYTDNLTHDLGGGEVNTPSLRWLWDTAPYYSDGRAATLFDVFRVDDGPHALLGHLPLAELDALIRYLESLPLEE